MLTPRRSTIHPSLVKLINQNEPIKKIRYFAEAAGNAEGCGLN
jgi:hypothetical protein